MAYVNVRISRHLKEELDCAIDKRLQLIINIMLFQTVIPLRILRMKSFGTLINHYYKCIVQFKSLLSIQSYQKMVKWTHKMFTQTSAVLILLDVYTYIVI